MSASARTRRRLPSEIFDLPVEKMREGYYWTPTSSSPSRCWSGTPITRAC